MTVADLIKHLQSLDESLVVVLSSDGEGNHFSPVAGYDARYVYSPSSSWNGELYELEEGETLEDFKTMHPNAQKAVVLYPVS